MAAGYDRLIGLVTRTAEHYVILTDADGQDYFCYRNALDSFGPQIGEIGIGATCSFTPIRGDRDRLRAIEVRVQALGPGSE